MPECRAIYLLVLLFFDNLLVDTPKSSEVTGTENKPVSTQRETTMRKELMRATTREIAISIALKLTDITTQSTPTSEARVATTTTTVSSGRMFAQTTIRPPNVNTVLTSIMLTTAITNIRVTSTASLRSSFTNYSSNKMPTQRKQDITTQLTRTKVAAAVAATNPTVSSAGLFAASFTSVLTVNTVLTSSMLTTAITDTTVTSYTSSKNMSTQETQAKATQLIPATEAAATTTTTTTTAATRTTKTVSSAGLFAATARSASLVNTVLTSSMLATAIGNVKETLTVKCTSSVVYDSSYNTPTQAKQTTNDYVRILTILIPPGSI